MISHRLTALCIVLSLLSNTSFAAQAAVKMTDNGVGSNSANGVLYFTAEQYALTVYAATQAEALKKDNTKHSKTPSSTHKSYTAENRDHESASTHSKDKGANEDTKTSSLTSLEKKKTFVCTECQKTFSQLAPLKTHFRTHTNERPYPCIECNRCFKDQGNLTRHMRTHTGVRPHKCSECPYKAARKYRLIKHMQSKHNK